jgi:Flp pilus assembly protein TadG
LLRFPKKFDSPKSNQQGFVLVIVAIGAVVMIGMAGIALDFAHAATNRARLQNSLDAAALAAARVLSVNSNQIDAETAGRQIFRNNIQSAENNQLVIAGASDNDLIIEFSNTVKPFVVDATATNFVRIRMQSDISFDTWFLTVFGQNDLSLRSSAVAGVSPVLGSSCNLAPFVVCGDETMENYGYPYGSTATIKLDNNASNIGVGNFLLSRLYPEDHGGGDLRRNMAGDSATCLGLGDTIETEPGNSVGPVSQGLNTRFGDYYGPVSADDYPPDKVVAEFIDYADYQDRYEESEWDYVNGQSNRRVISIPIADCSVPNPGQSTLSTYPTPLCVFLTQRAGSTGNTQIITAEVIDGCVLQGIPGPAPVFGPGNTTIQLYGDPDRWDT